MGGIGSGRYGWQSTMENTKRLDIRWLNKNGKLKAPQTGSLKWTSNGRETGSINFETQRDKMILRYRSRDSEFSEWQTVEQTIWFEETPCNYGGTRKWFACPKCSRRVAVLAGLGTYFYCRKCYRLPYRSTLETESDRALTKKHELGEQIFEHYEFGEGWLKKKGMHQKTFQRKLAEYRRLEHLVNLRSIRYVEELSKM